MFWKVSSGEEVEQCDREEGMKERAREEEEECQVFPSGSKTLQRSSGRRGDGTEPLTGFFF